MKILIFGLPGSGKSTLAEPLAKMVGGVWINADKIREEYNDWDFTDEGRMRQAMRMKFLSDGVVKAGKIAITDFVCPFQKARDQFNPDYTIYMNTIKEGRFEDTNAIFEKPTEVDCEISSFYPDAHEEIGQLILDGQWQKK